jgi:Zn-dependent M28 family amino/carboxypeptidase
MELARAFAESGIQFDATLVFITWAGEEQGLVGSNVHAEDLKKANVPIEAVFNNDIVGNSLGGNGIRDAESVRVYAIGPEDSPARALARHIQKTAAVYVPSHRIRLMAREDRFGRGSDQSSFTRTGSRRSSSANRTRISSASTASTTRSTASISGISRRTRASMPPVWRHWRWRRRRRR